MWILLCKIYQGGWLVTPVTTFLYRPLYRRCWRLRLRVETKLRGRNSFGALWGVRRTDSWHCEMSSFLAIFRQMFVKIVDRGPIVKVSLLDDCETQSFSSILYELRPGSEKCLWINSACLTCILTNFPGQILTSISSLEVVANGLRRLLYGHEQDIYYNNIILFVIYKYNARCKFLIVAIVQLHFLWPNRSRIWLILPIASTLSCVLFYWVRVIKTRICVSIPIPEKGRLH